MKIVEIREKTIPISSPIRNAYIDFSKMTLSLVAVVTDVIRDGKPVVGYGFNSNGRYGQGKLMRERFIPRMHGSRARIARRRQRQEPRPAQDLGHACSPTRSPAATASARSPSAPSTWRSGTRWPRSKASRCSSCWPTATATASRTARSSSTPPAATTTRARTTSKLQGRDAQLHRPRLHGGQEEDRRRLARRRPAPHRLDPERAAGRPEAVRRRQRPLRPGHRHRLRQGAVAVRPVLVRGAGRPARLRAAGHAAQLLQEPDGDRRGPVLDAGRAQPDPLRRHAARPRLAAVRLRAELRPGRVPAHARHAQGARLVGQPLHPARRPPDVAQHRRRPGPRRQRVATPTCSSPSAASPTA